MCMKCFIVFHLILFRIESATSIRENVRSKRALLFPGSSTVGILVALAVPLDLPHRNIFMSYNFEANYNSPYLPSSYIPGPLERLDLIDKRSFGASQSNETAGRAKTKRSHEYDSYTLLSRSKAYKILEDKLNYIGLPGKWCLLRVICDVNSEEIGYHNGVLGDILHIIFAPSTSRIENLPKEYYKAEYDGRRKSCGNYQKYCVDNILDYISKVVHI